MEDRNRLASLPQPFFGLLSDQDIIAPQIPRDSQR
jgi:hypothetical protein